MAKSLKSQVYSSWESGWLTWVEPTHGIASSLRAFKGNHLEALVLSDFGKEGHWLLWEALWWWNWQWLWNFILTQELWLPRGKSSLCEVLISWCSSFFPVRTLVDCSIPANWELEDERSMKNLGGGTRCGVSATWHQLLGWRLSL